METRESVVKIGKDLDDVYRRICLAQDEVFRKELAEARGYVGAAVVLLSTLLNSE